MAFQPALPACLPEERMLLLLLLTAAAPVMGRAREVPGRATCATLCSSINRSVTPCSSDTSRSKSASRPCSGLRMWQQLQRITGCSAVMGGCVMRRGVYMCKCLLLMLHSVAPKPQAVDRSSHSKLIQKLKVTRVQVLVLLAFLVYQAG
jgi:hypothetical protein